MSYQNSLFPVRIVRETPFTGTATLKLIGEGDDGRRYAIKRIEDGPLVPITEWVCHHVARAIGIPTPDFTQVTRKDGTVAFGSRWEDFQQVSEVAGPLDVQVIRFFGSLPARCSAVYGLDAFLANPDRHCTNIFFRETQSGQYIPVAYDFSHGWVISGLPFGAVPLPPDCNTLKTVRWLQRASLFSDADAHGAVDALLRASTTTIRAALDSAHPSWIPTNWNHHETLQVWEDSSARSLHASTARTALP